MTEKRNNAVGPQIRANKPQTSKLIPILALITLAAGLATSTQFFAHEFSYQAALGPHYGQLYPPWAIVIWASNWYAKYPDIFMKAGSVGMMVTSVGLILLVVTKMVQANTSKASEYLHGSARWAGKRDIEQAGLLGNDEGVYVGGWLDKKGEFHYLRHNGPEHILCYARRARVKVSAWLCLPCYRGDTAPS